MLALISPAKKINKSTKYLEASFTQPQFKQQISSIINEITNLDPVDIMKLMSISEDLAMLNYDRYADFNCNTYNENNSKPAIYTFRGDVYQGIDADTLSLQDLDFAQKFLLILSGLYGLIKPLDLIQPYRLEMGTKLKFGKYKNLYDFWQDTLTSHIQEVLKGHENKTIINLASDEYAKAVSWKNLDAKIIKVDFKENKNGIYKTIGIHAKKARGNMIRYIINNRIEEHENIKHFNINAYEFNKDLSSQNTFTFTR